MPAPTAFRQYLGASFVKAYEAPALTIGEQTFTRYEVAHMLDCPVTPKAMGILTRALADLNVKTRKQALDLHAIDLADIVGVGTTTLYLFLCWQRSERSTDKAVATWYGDTVTFHTLKRRVQKRKARGAEPKRRKAS
jgi:hypothetical protein